MKGMPGYVLGEIFCIYKNNKTSHFLITFLYFFKKIYKDDMYTCDDSNLECVMKLFNLNGLIMRGKK